jgi:hypothetical protein
MRLAGEKGVDYDRHDARDRFALAVKGVELAPQHRLEISAPSAAPSLWGARGTESLQTLRWRETDSNHRSLVQETGRFGGNAKTFEGRRR